MTLMNGAVAKLSAYNRDAVLSASPVRLLTMLYDRLVLDLSRAETGLSEQDWAVAAENLRHADRIVDELSSSLRLDAWDGADGLLQLYIYVSGLIVTGNIDRDVDKVREARILIEPLCETWHEAAALLPAAGSRGAYAMSGSPSGEARDLGIA
ncbi:flagellar export chaperone FliS [Leifsonia sp. NPDC058230]|uniref:flagellar export chaperone FliS n=1 Tax=Leifsonia sp. NPDC058230 TaxID=3346391 RepID=UPI0036DF5DA9